VKKKINSAYFHIHTATDSTWSHAGHVQKNASATPKQALKNVATPKSDLNLNQSCGSRKKFSPT
jgi:hypothetical protein